MRNIIVILGLLTLIGTGCFVGVKQAKTNDLNGQCLAGQGCCSWHGGQCGCSNSGRVICCDGTYSPSCRCY